MNIYRSSIIMFYALNIQLVLKLLALMDYKYVFDSKLVIIFIIIYLKRNKFDRNYFKL